MRKMSDLKLGLQDINPVSDPNAPEYSAPPLPPSAPPPESKGLGALNKAAAIGGARDKLQASVKGKELPIGNVASSSGIPPEFIQRLEAYYASLPPEAADKEPDITQMSPGEVMAYLGNMINKVSPSAPPSEDQVMQNLKLPRR